MKLRYTQRARRHLDIIADYIGERNPDGPARRRADWETIGLLVQFPYIGHQGALAGTREIVVPGLPYVVVHRVETGENEAIVILGVYHGAQLRPGQG